MYKSTKISPDNYLIEKRVSFLGMWGFWIPVENFSGTRQQRKTRMTELRHNAKQQTYGILSVFIGG